MRGRGAHFAHYSHHNQSIFSNRPTLSSPEPVVSKSQVELVSMLNVGAYSDVEISAKGSTVPIQASRIVLSSACKYFHAMFGEAWSNSGPVVLDYSSGAIAICLLYIYSSWLPGDPLLSHQNVTDLFDQLNVNLACLEFDLLRDVVMLANMVGLDELAVSANRALIKVIELEISSWSK